MRYVKHLLLALVFLDRGANLVQNVGERPVRGVCGTEVLQVQGRGPGRGSGGLRPPEAEAILDFYMDNFDLILNYFPPHSKFWGDVSPPPRFTPVFVDIYLLHCTLSCGAVYCNRSCLFVDLLPR